MTVAEGTLSRERHLTLFRIGALAFLGTLVLLAWWIFRLSGHDYWRFWLNSGPVIGLATAAFGWAWGSLDRRPDLVSADPVRYLAGVFGTCALPFVAFSAHFGQSRAAANVASFLRDLIIALLLFAVVFLPAVTCWLVLIAPAQYFAFLIFGAPSRIALRSHHRIYVRQDEREVSMVEAFAWEADRFPEKDGWWDGSMRDRPVTVSSGFMAASLLMLNVFLT